MTPAQLERVGVALYGQSWRADLSRLWQISDRTIRNWASGKGRPTAAHIAELREHIATRIGILQDLLVDLDPGGDGGDPGV